MYKNFFDVEMTLCICWVIYLLWMATDYYYIALL